MPNAQPVCQKSQFHIWLDTVFLQTDLILSSVCHYHILDLRRIRHTFDSTTATTIATALVHSRLDYCNTFYHGLPITQIKLL